MTSFNADHNSASPPKETSVRQNHHQEEIIHKLAMQLKNIGDGIDHRMVPEVRPPFVRQAGEKADRTMAVKGLGCPGSVLS